MSHPAISLPKDTVVIAAGFGDPGDTEMAAATLMFHEKGRRHLLTLEGVTPALLEEIYRKGTEMFEAHRRAVLASQGE